MTSTSKYVWIPSKTSVACILIGCGAALLAYSSAVHSSAVDEVSHLPSGLAHWKLSRFEPYAVNPHLVRMVASIPLLVVDSNQDWRPLSRVDIRVADRVEWKLGKPFVERNGERVVKMWTFSRWILIPLIGIGTWVVRCWGDLLYGAGAVSLALFAFSPGALGYGSTITPDVVSASLGITAVYAIQNSVRSTARRLSIIAGLVFCFAVMAKSTWLFVLPCVVLTGNGVEYFCQSALWKWRDRMICLWIVFSVTLIGINAAYGFEGTFTRVGSYPFCSRLLSNNPIPGTTWPENRFHNTIVGEIPIPLPKVFVEGLDVQKSDFDAGFRSYLMGQWKFRGWWYYYLVGFLVKEPIGFQLMLYVSILQGLWNWRRWTKESFREWSLIVLPPVLIFGLVSSQTGFNHHMRYVLPAYPFLFIIAARTVTLGRFWKWFSYACLIWQAAAVLWFAPHWMSYFNEFAGGPKNGHKWLVDSNIDWGQDILMLKWWQDKHPEATPLHAALYTGFDPKDIGLKFKLPAPFVKGRRDIVSKEGLRGPQPGWYAVSVCMLKGLHFNVPEGNGEWSWSTENFTYFLDHFEPVDRIGYSISIYHISEADAARVREQLLSAEQEE